MLKTLVTAMLPVLEIRAAIPVGIAEGLSPWLAYLIGVIGNLLPVPFIILLMRHILEWLKRHNILVRFTHWLERRTEKNARMVQRYRFWGLLILVAIPLPGTGAWTGAAVASLFDMRLKKALPAITLGVLIAGGIVMAITVGVISVSSAV